MKKRLVVESALLLVLLVFAWVTTGPPASGNADAAIDDLARREWAHCAEHGSPSREAAEAGLNCDLLRRYLLTLAGD